MTIADLNRINMVCRPIVTWPGTMTRNRGRAPFRARWETTLSDLGAELRMIEATSAALEVACREDDILADGSRPKHNASISHPGVILSVTTKKLGPIRFVCDHFTDWRDNVRAITLGMSDLRRLDRYGITKRGEQYQGWKQLPPPTMGQVEVTNPKQAIVLLFQMAGEKMTSEIKKDQLRSLYKRAAMKHHPDQGGDEATFTQLGKVWAMLKATYSL